MKAERIESFLAETDDLLCIGCIAIATTLSLQIVAREIEALGDRIGAGPATVACSACGGTLPTFVLLA